jgi:hypothetical protein
MDDLPHDTLDVVVALSRVQHTVLGCTLAVGVVGLEHRSPTLTLGPDNATHLQDSRKFKAVLKALPTTKTHSTTMSSKCTQMPQRKHNCSPAQRMHCTDIVYNIAQATRWPALHIQANRRRLLG